MKATSSPERTFWFAVEDFGALAENYESLLAKTGTQKLCLAPRCGSTVFLELAPVLELVREHHRRRAEQLCQVQLKKHAELQRAARVQPDEFDWVDEDLP